jgi:hypothetical protein
VFFLLLYFFYDIPAHLKQIYQYIYTFLEYSFFAFFLWSNIGNRRLRVIIIVFSALFAAFQIVFFLVGKETKLDTIPVGIETIFLFVFIFFFFYHHFNTSKSQFIYHNYGFWIALGILVYLGGSFFFNLLANHIDPTYWFVTYITETIKNILFFIALIVYSKTPRENSLDKKPLPYLDMMI